MAILTSSIWQYWQVQTQTTDMAILMSSNTHYRNSKTQTTAGMVILASSKTITNFKVERKAKIRNWYNQVPYLTLNTTWESDKNTGKHKHKSEFNPGPVPYFRGDWSWNNFYGHSPPFRWIIQEGLLSVTSESMCTNYWLTACSSLPRKKCG